MTQAETCVTVPEFERLKYFYGQLLGIRDFQAEQAYFREKMKLHHRCLHGYGVVCGLQAASKPISPQCDTPALAKARDLRVQEVEKLQAIEAARQELAGVDDEDRRAQHTDGLNQLLVAAEDLQRQIEELCPVPGNYDGSFALLTIDCGMAIDCEGNELVVRHPLCVDLWRELSPRQKTIIRDQKGPGTLYVSLCYCQLEVEPTRPLHQDSCSSYSKCEHGRIRDSIKVVVSLEAPAEDVRCNGCCEPCQNGCLLLARIDHFYPGLPLADGHIHNQVRRDLSPYQHSVITGISWVHGGTYNTALARKVLGTDTTTPGLEIRFSKPVQRATITLGVLDLWVIEGGKGRSAGIYHMAGEFHGMADPYCDRIFYRQTTGEALNAQDRVLITLRAGFILDKCCRPVDGNHVGGKVGLLPEYAAFQTEPAHQVCPIPPRGYGPWTSGNGTAGGDFQSWFYIS